MSSSWLGISSLQCAFSRVRENHGCAGADGVEIDEFAGDLASNLAELAASVQTGRYFAWPLRRIEIEKKPGSPERRTLLVPAVRDRVLQTAVAAYFEPYLEREFESCSFAYRRGRSVRMAVELVNRYYLEGYHWLLDADIEAFFDSVHADVVLARLRPLIPDELAVRLVRLWLDYAIWDGLTLRRPGVGLPQGAVISPMLANLCLDSLDERLLEAGLKVVRYADDYVVLTKSRKRAELALEISRQELERLRLRLHQGKTRVVRFSEGFRFLGVIFLKDLLLQPFRARKRLKVLSVAPPLPPALFPLSERRPLHRYREA